MRLRYITVAWRPVDFAHAQKKIISYLNSCDSCWFLMTVGCLKISILDCKQTKRAEHTSRTDRQVLVHHHVPRAEMKLHLSLFSYLPLMCIYVLRCHK